MPAIRRDRHPDSLNRLELEDWRATLSPARATTGSGCPTGARLGGRRNLARDATVHPQPETVTAHVATCCRSSRGRRSRRSRPACPRYQAIPFVVVGCGLRPGTVRAAPLRRRPGGPTARHQPPLHGGSAQGGRQQGRLRPAAPVHRRARRARPDAAEDRHADPATRPSRRLHRHRRFRHRAWTRRGGGGARASPHLHLPAHVRDLGDQLVFRSGSSPRHGHLSRPDRGHLRSFARANDEQLRAAFDAYDVRTVVR